MTLNELLEAYRRHCEAQWSVDERAGWMALLARVRSSDVMSAALQAGDLAPDLTLAPAYADLAGTPGGKLDGATDGAIDGGTGGASGCNAGSLYAMLERGPLVVKFVPGRECPYSTLELRAYQRILAQLQALGGQLLVFTGRDAQDAAYHRQRDGLSFPIVADADQTAARRFGLLVPEPGASPICLPATFVVGRDRRIVYAFVEPDLRLRAEPARVLSAVAAVAAVSPVA